MVAEDGSSWDYCYLDGFKWFVSEFKYDGYGVEYILLAFSRKGELYSDLPVVMISFFVFTVRQNNVSHV